MFNFLPHSPEERQDMLKAIGVASADALFADIPAQLREGMTYNVLPKTGQCEWELQETVKAYANENAAKGKRSFLGGGAYSRFIPMAVNTIAGRSEFYTAYTPYQPEMSQGTLQVGYEFQTLIAELTGMDAANASVYDGGTALAEAALMALRIGKKKKTLVVDKTVHPQYRQIIDTYVDALGDITVQVVDLLNDMPAPNMDAAALLVQHPNFLGQLMPVETLRQWCDDSKALLVVSADPVSLGALEAPGQYGADLVVGDIQPLGNHLSFGGPYGGFMATKNAYTRQLPGRLVGKAVDKDGRPCYTLTMQTREQHIRRDKATSNICTNQALNVLRATVYLSLVGPQGLAHIAKLSAVKAHQLARKLSAVAGMQFPLSQQPYLNEFVVQPPIPVEQFLAGLESRGILGGIPLQADYPELDNALLVTTTELTTDADIQHYVDAAMTLCHSQVSSHHSGSLALESSSQSAPPTQNADKEVCLS